MECAPGSSNDGGDNPNEGDTSCEVTYCQENEYVDSDHVCQPCEDGYTADAGADATGASTSCDAPPAPTSSGSSSNPLSGSGSSSGASGAIMFDSAPNVAPLHATLTLMLLSSLLLVV